jgi:hypothetical protein
VDLSDIGGFRTLEKLFSEGGSRIIVEVSPDKEARFLEVFKGVPATLIGSTTEGAISIEDCGLTILKSEIGFFRKHWDSGMNVLY